MAEYWKSAPKVWCKQCKIFIRDTAFEKTQHEATGKHQGNLKRFLRDIHRNNEQQQRETQRAKNEVERLRQTVAGSAAGGKDGDAAPWKRAAPAPKPQERPVSLEERKRQMAQLAEMGIAIPDEFRGEMALAGEWQTTSEKVVRSEDDAKADISVGVRKRKHEERDEEEEEAKREAERFVSKGWGSRTRQYPGAQEDTDLDALLESTKDIKKAKPSIPANAALTKEPEPLKGQFIPIKLEGDAGASEPDAPKKEEPETDAPAQVKVEETESILSVPAATHEPEDAPAAGVVFKKRKPKIMRK
ncbi:hypothetical protein BO70DRAFT_406580 [Aspergillus heteromorphus CBS 117.55]|uniref:U1-type domain-containing protein n=1 Tax=Aspergillus heteromorphus CBS 117.55 TaxID=1448321 RepID=A0A317W4U7_9EURO|nr:uncharacterized protein BO70DRAFT_406580 [Aspergillus heteromorphus CBS 117.55]PWY80591.1 hypothetical protein BO70DRAFT_406580 [Aspergillus heteromorphus CBS 117.55]